jgi:hypothetical protein
MITTVTTTNIDNCQQLVRSRPEPIIEDIVLQSSILWATIIEFQYLMLHKLAIITQHKKISLLFTKFIIYFKTGNCKQIY